jgi:hypothetical protein
MPPIPNSIWNILWKINQIAVPVLIAWGVWVTKSVFAVDAWMDKGDRFTQSQALRMELELRSEIQKSREIASANDLMIIERLNAMPPQDWKDRIMRIERSMEDSGKLLAHIAAKLEEKRP